jgi:DMSO/TMAO reductase YedYZ molybdopterin-dependent catalytic subunit
MNTGDTGWKIPSANLSNGSDGSLIVSGFTGWAQASWVVQVNFAPVPTGVTGTNYELSFDYKISSAGGDAQIFDTVTIGSVVTLSVTSTWVTAKIDFAGGVTTSNSKFTFELGALAATSVDFELTNITLVAR